MARSLCSYTPRFLAVLPLLFSVAAASAQTLLKDFNTTPSTVVASSYPSQFSPLPFGRSLFAATTPWTGLELWTTDGTPTGTRIVEDIWPGAGGRISQIIEFASGVYLVTASSHEAGWELWRTDGTAAGTTLVKDIWPGAQSSVAVGLTRVGNRVVFLADDGVHGIEPWVTDGTPAGTTMIADIAPIGGMSNGTATLAALDANRFVFSALRNNQWEIWVSDMTAAGTTPLVQLGAISTWNPQSMTSFGNRVLFAARTGSNDETVWVTDGTTAGTFSLGVESQNWFEVAGSLAYFAASTTTAGVELWKTDGTIAGTSMVIDLLPGGGPNVSGSPSPVGELQGDLIFFGTTPAGRFLLRTDGTAAGTTTIGNVATMATFFGTGRGTRIGNELWYSVNTGPGPLGLYRTDGTALGTTMVTPFATSAIGSLGNLAVLAADDGSGLGVELWTSDGTPAGTQLVADLAASPITQSSFPGILGTFRDQVVVAGQDTNVGNEVWLTDGTAPGTRLLADLEPGPGSTTVHGIASSEARMLLLAEVPSGDGDPWFYDGTNLTQLDILPANSGFRGFRPRAFGDRFLFAGRLPTTGYEPWITDGTVAGTHTLGDLFPGTVGSVPTFYFALGNRMLFAADAAVSPGLWQTDGTPGGTSFLAPLGSEPIELGGRAWFVGSSTAPGIDLWSTDGTAAGTTQQVLLAGLGASLQGNLTAIGGRLLLQVKIADQPRLVSTDGTPAGTTVLSFAAPEIWGPHAASADRAIFFVPGPQGVRDQLWRTDGTDAGTVFGRPIETLVTNPRPTRIGREQLLVPLDDAFTGLELWTTDGTPARTLPVVDLAPGGNFPYGMARAGDRLVFAADDGVHGVELFAVPFTFTRDWVADTFGTGCAGSTAPTIAVEGRARVSAPPFAIAMNDALPGAFAGLALSFGRGPFQVPGCTFWIGGSSASALTVCDALGHAAVSLTVPPALVGVRFDAQFVAFDPLGPVLGLAASTPAIEVVVGQ